MPGIEPRNFSERWATDVVKVWETGRQFIQFKFSILHLTIVTNDNGNFNETQVTTASNNAEYVQSNPKTVPVRREESHSYLPPNDPVSKERLTKQKAFQELQLINFLTEQGLWNSGSSVVNSWNIDN